MKTDNALKLIELVASTNSSDIEESNENNFSTIAALCIVVSNLSKEMSLLLEKCSRNYNSINDNKQINLHSNEQIGLHKFEQSLDLIKLFDDTLAGKLNLDEAVEIFEKEIIRQAIQKTKYNKTAASELLGISFRALRYKLKIHNME